jgi:hypothetical protein
MTGTSSKAERAFGPLSVEIIGSEVFVSVSVTTENIDVLDEINGNEAREPPWLAEALLYVFARTKDIDALRGDFEEYFERDCAEGMSERRAVARYWARVFRSVGPQMWQAIKRVSGWAGLVAVVLRR